METEETAVTGDIVQIGDDFFEEMFRCQASTGADIQILLDLLRSVCIINFLKGTNRQMLLVQHAAVGGDDCYRFTALASDWSYGFPDLYDFLPTISFCMKGEGALDRFAKPVSEYFKCNLQ